MFELDLRARELRKGEARVRLQEQPFEILRMMLERPGDVVTRDELRQRLWPEGTFVDFEHSLNAAIKRLRAALGDDAENPRFVETLPRRGYRFIAEVAGARNTASASASERRAPADKHVARVAVLPFTNLSEDPGQQYFSDGLTEEMIAQLGQLCGGRLGVIARTSSMGAAGSGRSAREIGEFLRVSYLLEGSVRWEGQRLRITARLVETAGETHLWADTFERQGVDCLSVQADVAARIARSLAMELLPGHASSPGLPDPVAYQTYLKGRFYWNKPGDAGLPEAIQFFEQALAEDPTFAAAHAALARAYVARAEYYGERPVNALEVAEGAAARALELAPDLADGHLAMAEVRRILKWDWPGAEEAYTRALALNPSCEGAHRAYGVMLAALGRFDEAIREVDRAFELDPLCLVVGSATAWVRYVAGDTPGVVERCRHTIDIDPRYGFSIARRLLGAAYLLDGRRKEAVAEMENALSTSGREPVLLAWLAHAKAVNGETAAARTLVAELQALEGTRHVPAYHLALAHVGLGDRDAAFAALDKACADRDPVLAGLGVEPRFEPLRSDIRYGRLMTRLGLRRADRGHEAHSA